MKTSGEKKIVLRAPKIPRRKCGFLMAEMFGLEENINVQSLAYPVWLVMI